jgi:hypothetical protein
MSMFLLNKSLIEKMDKHRRRSFWAVKKKKKAYCICRSKLIGVLVVKDLGKQNISLLCNGRGS